MRGLTAVEARSTEIEELRADLGRQLERVRSAAVITLVGATGAGKSTLLNALVGKSVAHEGENRPTLGCTAMADLVLAELGVS